jgi:hypothetical protein
VTLATVRSRSIRRRWRAPARGSDRVTSAPPSTPPNRSAAEVLVRQRQHVAPPGKRRRSSFKVGRAEAAITPMRERPRAASLEQTESRGLSAVRAVATSS